MDAGENLVVIPAPEDVAGARARAPRPAAGRGGAARPAPGIASVLLGLLLWEALAWVAPRPPVVLPTPDAVLARLWDLAVTGALWPHLGTTLLEAGAGFGLAAVGGLVLGYPVARSRLLETLLAPYVAGTQAIPVVAVAPLMVLWFGIDLLPKVLTCAVIVFFPILVNTVIGLRSVDRDLIGAAQICGAGQWQILWHVEIPLALRPLLGGLKLGLTLAMTGAVVGEFIAANAGLGYLLILGRQSFDTALVFAALLTLMIAAITGYAAIGRLEQYLIDWDE